MACDGARRELAAATPRLEEHQLRVVVGGVAHPVPVGPLKAGESWSASSPWDSGMGRWTELALLLGADGRLWVERIDREDVHLAGRGHDAPAWLASPDGAAWAAVAAPAERGRELARVST